MTGLRSVSTMPWLPEYVTGVASIDDQHRNLVHLINGFGELVRDAMVPGAEAMEAVLDDLARYAERHFGEEEVLFADAGIDADSLTTHRAEHARFLAEIAQRQNEPRAAGTDACEALLAYLCHWLDDHILGSDKAMVRTMYVSARQRTD